MSEDREDAAWEGRSPEERRRSTPQTSYERYQLKGYLPNMERIGMGLLYLVGGLILLAIYFGAVSPEWRNISASPLCYADCAISKIAILVVGVVTGIGGVGAVIYGFVTAVDGFCFFGQNEISVRLRKLR